MDGIIAAAMDTSQQDGRAVAPGVCRASVDLANREPPFPWISKRHFRASEYCNFRFLPGRAAKSVPFVKTYKRSWGSDETVLRIHVLPTLGKMALDEVTACTSSR